MSEELLYFNGINGSTGEYLLSPMPVEQFASLIQGEEWDPEHKQDLEWRHYQDENQQFALKEGLDPRDLSQAGWGVIFSADADPDLNAAIREALSELLDLRRTQAGLHYREFFGAEGFRRSDSKNVFLQRHGAGPGPVDPVKVPYYLLIVGDPQSIPYRFQYELDVAYAVGRIHFRTLDEYAQYARSVVLAETGRVTLPRRAAFFGVSNPDDKATTLSTEQLLKPLAQTLSDEHSTWKIDTVFGDAARKDQLGRFLGGDDTPALIFTGSHGMGFSNGDPLQVPFQGALLCQDWPGPLQAHGPIKREYYFGAEDVASDANPLGLVAFHFACYGAGTPYWDDFSRLRPDQPRQAVAPHAFLAALPQRLLSHPKGGALAVVGHVERAWTYSFSWGKAGAQPLTFENTIARLFGGHPVGSAVDYLNSRYAEIATMLSSMLDEAEYVRPNPFQLASLWTAHNDARGYAIIGDPAVRLPVASADGESQPRPTIAAVDHQDRMVPLVLVPEALPEESQRAKPKSPAVSPGPSADPAGPPTSPPPAGDLLAEMSEDGLQGEAFWVGEESLKHLRDQLARALQQLAERFSTFVGDVASLEVATYVSDDMEEVKYDRDTQQFVGGAKQRALTRINFDGDMHVCVPVNTDDVDEELWAIHLSLVEQAQANRAAMLKVVAEVLTGLIAPKG